VDRLTPIEQGAQLAAKLRIAEEVAQEQRAQQFAQVIRSFVDGVAWAALPKRCSATIALTRPE
jgi:hypothetical protein